MNAPEIERIDKAIEVAELVRASEAGYARDHRMPSAFGAEGDRIRLDAFTLGLLDTLARRISTRVDWLELMVYLHKLLEHGPGERVRSSSRQMQRLAESTSYARYVAGGRHHAQRMLLGHAPEVGRFSRLMSDEHHGY